MIVFLYPGLEIELFKEKDKLSPNMECFKGLTFWWTPDNSIHNGTYIRDLTSQILLESEDGKTVLTECQPVMREAIYNHKDNEKIAIIFPSEGLKESYLERLNNTYQKLSFCPYHFDSIYNHIKENFEYDIRAIMYEASYNRNWYDIAYAIKDKDYKLLDIINKIQGELK